jgi:hypothetical protein
MLQLEGSKVAQKFNIPVTEFKTSYEWVWQFLSHQQLLIHRRTNFSKTIWRVWRIN